MLRGLANLLSSITVLFIYCLSSLFISSSGPLNFLSFGFFSLFFFSFSNSSISTYFSISSSRFCLATFLPISSFFVFFGSFKFSSFSIPTSTFSNLFLAISCYCYCYFLLYLDKLYWLYPFISDDRQFKSEIDKQKRRKQKNKNRNDEEERISKRAEGNQGRK